MCIDVLSSIQKRRYITMKKLKKGFCLLLVVLLTLSVCPFVASAEEGSGEDAEDEGETLLAPYFIIQSEDADSSIDYFPLKSTDVTTNINGVIAKTTVVQTYVNEGDKPINARYVFPTSSTVTVHGMKMEIGNHVVTAQIKEKEEAKEEYEEAKSEGKSVSLLEQKRPNVFTMDVANIMPGDTARIELHYTEMITSVEGIYEFVFPTVVGPRYVTGEPSAPVADNEVISKVVDNQDVVSDSRDAAEDSGSSNDDIAAGDGADDESGSASGKADGSDGSSDSDKKDGNNNTPNSDEERNSDSSSDSGKDESSDSSSTSDKADSSDTSSDSDRADSSDTSSDSDKKDGSDTSSNSDKKDGGDASSDSDEKGDSNSPSDSDKADGNDSGRPADSWTSSPYLPNGAVPDSEYHITVNLSTGVPIADVSCKSHEINVAKNGDSQATITLANPEDYAGNRDFILKYKLTNETVQSGLMLTSSGDENFFLLTVQPPERFTPEDIPPREYIFVLDISGSMYGYPLDTAKALIRNLVGNLKETDKFNLVLFEDDTYLLADKSLPANSKNVAIAMKLIDDQEGGGGTSLLPALNEAISIPMDRDYARSVVIITDGYISNESEIYDLINENMGTASFFSFGIGCSVNDYLIKGIAQCGFGEAFTVTDAADADEYAERFRTYIESPLLTGITVDYGGFQVYDVATATPSILYAQKPLVLFGKWRGEPSGTITVSGQTGSENYVQEIPINDVAVDTENEAIRYLWARTKLDTLTGFGSIRNDDSVKEEITSLGLDYNMTTPYTSFIAVVEEVRNPQGDSQDVNQALPLPLQVSNLAVGGGYTAYSEPGGIILGVILTVVSFFGILRQNRKSSGTPRKKKRH